jgi:hypothetical protein
MNQKTTPDERFLIKLYQTALASGDPLNPVKYRSVAKATGMKESATKNTIKLLAQANFVEKLDEETLCLTKRGCGFVEDQI